MLLSNVCEAGLTYARGVRLRSRRQASALSRWLASAAAVAALAGCALSPGMTYNGIPAGDVGGAVTTSGPGGTNPAASALAKTGADGAPAGSLVEITRELVEKERAERPAGLPDGVTELFSKPKPYEIGPGDILSIVVWDHPELNMPATVSPGSGTGTSGSSSVSQGYTVDTNGFIQYAYIGPLKVEGLTEMGARDALADKLARYVRQPQVTVRVEAYRSKRVYIDGEVKTPGVEVVNDMPMTLPEAINRAGGFTDKSDRSRVAVTRGDKTVVVDMPEMIRKGFNPDRIMLRDGDLVREVGS